MIVNKWMFMIDFKKLVHGCENEDKLTEDMKKTAKPSETKIEFLSYDDKSDTSLVRCLPKTGRTHQIRVHLQSLGTPIANDMQYGGTIINDGSGRESLWHEEFAGCFEGEDKDDLSK